MTDDLAESLPRSDPFGMGLAAHRERLPRRDCPYPAAHVEGQRWLEGWDHARDCDAAALADREQPQPRGRRWSHGELVVLATLVRSGETLASLASRLGRPRAAIQAECAIRNLELVEGP